jgi:hypothetical protein
MCQNIGMPANDSDVVIENVHAWYLFLFIKPSYLRKPLLWLVFPRSSLGNTSPPTSAESGFYYWEIFFTALVIGYFYEIFI